jgi:hypothetical protein
LAKTTNVKRDHNRFSYFLIYRVAFRQKGVFQQPVMAQFAMLKVNEYFEGKVKSVSFKSPQGDATAGVMAPGDYEFSTGLKELMKVTSGKLTVKIPGDDSWKDFPEGSSFTVPAKSKFLLKVGVDTSYLCFFLAE